MVADPAAPGTFWVSTADANVSIPGATGATWQSLFNGYATQTWANGQFLQLANAAVQAVTGPVTFSGITTVPTPTDYTKKQAIGASDADGRYGRLSSANTWTNSQVFNSWIACSNSLAINVTSQNKWINFYIDNGNNVTIDLNAGTNTSPVANLGWLRFNAQGHISTPIGPVAFQSDLSHTTYSGNAGDAGSYTITVYTDPSTPSGKRYRISGQTAAFTGEGRQTISLPLTLNGILPGAWGATTFWNVNTSTSANDQIAQIIGAPTVASITVNMAVTADPSLTWPCYATWWVEGY